MQSSTAAMRQQLGQEEEGYGDTDGMDRDGDGDRVGSDGAQVSEKEQALRESWLAAREDLLSGVNPVEAESAMRDIESEQTRLAAQTYAQPGPSQAQGA